MARRYLAILYRILQDLDKIWQYFSRYGGLWGDLEIIERVGPDMYRSGYIWIYLARYDRTWPDMSILDKSFQKSKRFGGAYQNSTWHGAIRQTLTGLGKIRQDMK